MNKVLQWFLSLFRREPPVSHYTTDGHKLAPHPNMTDEDLHDFELCFDVRPRTFPRWPDRSPA